MGFPYCFVLPTSDVSFRYLVSDKFYLAIDKNFQTKGKVLPIDIDIVSNCVFLITFPAHFMNHSRSSMIEI